MKNLSLAGVVSALLLSSCADHESFSVEVDAPQLGTQLITVVHTLPSGNRAVTTTPAVDGKFSFECKSPEPSVVELYTGNKSPFAQIIAANGDKVKYRVDADGNISVDGSELTAELVRLAANYSDSLPASATSSVIAEALHSMYHNSSRNDWPKFTSPELFIHEDSVITLAPEGVWVFTAFDEERTSALLDTLRHYHKRKDVDVRDVWVGVDTLHWRAVTRNDSAKWTQAMLPDAPLILEGILRHTPALVEVDTAGTVLRVHNFE